MHWDNRVRIVPPTGTGHTASPFSTGIGVAAAGEIDLVCARGRTVVFAEVKARTELTHGHPFEAVTPSKQRRLHHLAFLYLHAQTVHWAELRFDVVAVLGNELEVLEGAF